MMPEAAGAVAVNVLLMIALILVWEVAMMRCWIHCWHQEENRVKCQHPAFRCRGDKTRHVADRIEKCCRCQRTRAVGVVVMDIA